MSTNACLIIRTGLPGNGKTLNTIKELDEQAFAQNRPVYYHNVTGLKPDKLRAEWYEFDDPLKWYELPQDAIIVVDEAQGSLEFPRFGVRDPRKAVPLHISNIEIIRKNGHELNLITQDPRFLDVHARRLCNLHVHYWRAFGSTQIVRFVMPRVKDDVEKISGFKDCEKSIVKLDKRYFDVYESAQAKHHFKFKIPKAAWLLVGCAFALGAVGYSLRDRFMPEVDSLQADEVSAVSSIKSMVTGAVGGSSEKGPLSIDSYIAMHKPRIPDVPSSAPIYDELTKPVSLPRTYCVSTVDEGLIERNGDKMAVSVVDGRVTGCQCYTQQNTRLTTSFKYCLDVVQNGRFDYTVPDRGSNSDQLLGNSSGSSLPASKPPTALMSAPVSSLTVVPDSEYASRPWR